MTAHPTARPATRSTGLMLTALVVGAVTAILDTTIVSMGLHTLTIELDASVATIQWVSTGYMLALALAILFVGWAQVRFGGKRLWLFALGVFVIASVLSAGAWSAGSLILFRVLQGLGGGSMFPLMQTLAMQNIAPADRMRTMAMASLPAALGPILGPVLGGLVLHWASWRWLFLINVPLGVIGLVLAVLFLTPDHPERGGASPALDVVGALLLVPALAGLLFGLSNVHAAGGLGRADVLLPGIVGAILLAGFVLWGMRREGRSLVDVRLLAVRSVRSSAITLAFLGAALFASTFLLPLFLRGPLGYGVLGAALLLIPQGVGSLVARFIAGQLVDRFGARAVAVTGFLVVAAATAPFALMGSQIGPWSMGLVLFVRGLGLGIVLIPVMTVAYVDIDRDRMPHASAITRLVQQLGGAFGIALIAVVLTSAATGSDPEAGYVAAFWCTLVLTVLALLASLLLPSTPTPTEHGEGRDGTAPEEEPSAPGTSELGSTVRA